MDRRGFNAAVLAASLCGTSAARAASQPVRRLGLLSLQPADQFLGGEWRKVLDALAALGYVAGQNLVLVERLEPQSVADLERFARELADARVDAIVTEGTPATLAVQKATRTIPVVTSVADFVIAGFARDVRRPGGNITGLSQNRSGLAAKQVEMLREMRPRLATVAILHYRELPGAELVYRAFAEAARERAIATPVMTHEGDDISMPVAEMKRQRIDTAYLLGGGSNLLEVARQGIAVMAAGAGLVAEGALVAMENDGTGDYRHVAELLDRIFRGGNPAEIPIEVATRYLTTLNARTAAVLGMKLTASLLLRVDRVIE